MNITLPTNKIDCTSATPAPRPEGNTQVDEWAGFCYLSEQGPELPPARDGYRWETIQKLHPNGHMLWAFKQVPITPRSIKVTEL